MVKIRWSSYNCLWILRRIRQICHYQVTMGFFGPYNRFPTYWCFRSYKLGRNGLFGCFKTKVHQKYQIAIIWMVDGLISSLPLDYRNNLIANSFSLDQAPQKSPLMTHRSYAMKSIFSYTEKQVANIYICVIYMARCTCREIKVNFSFWNWKTHSN